MTRLTKKMPGESGEEYCGCIYYGTEECRIHTDPEVKSCLNCPVLGAIINKLHFWEDVEEKLLGNNK